MNSPIISTTEKKFDWAGVTKKLSSLIALLATMCGSTLAYYSQLDPLQKSSWPWWIPLALTIAMPVLTASIPVATSYKQKNL